MFHNRPDLRAEPASGCKKWVIKILECLKCCTPWACSAATQDMQVVAKNGGVVGEVAAIGGAITGAAAELVVAGIRDAEHALETHRDNPHTTITAIADGAEWLTDRALTVGHIVADVLVDRAMGPNSSRAPEIHGSIAAAAEMAEDITDHLIARAQQMAEVVAERGVNRTIQDLEETIHVPSHPQPLANPSLEDEAHTEHHEQQVNVQEHEPEHHEQQVNAQEHEPEHQQTPQLNITITPAVQPQHDLMGSAALTALVGLLAGTSAFSPSAADDFDAAM